MLVLPQNFELQRYLKRISYNGTPKTNFDTLSKFMACHIRAVPFENLDVLAKKKISLAPEDIFEKIVNQKRGGYCYEINGMFAMVLQSLGFEYDFIFARPIYLNETRPQTHMALIVHIDGKKYLVDMGFGVLGIREPLLIDNEAAKEGYFANQGVDKFHLKSIENGLYLLSAFNENEWLPRFSFGLDKANWVDFGPANHWNSTHESVMFVQRPVIAIINDKGRKTIFGDMFKIVENGIVTKRQFAPNEIHQILADHFNLENIS